MWTVATYVLEQKLKGRKRYPLVLMLEPLFRCNLACAGCGKIQYPAHILKKDLSPEDCFKAVEECGAPMVSIPGGEPLMHPQIDKIVEGLVDRKKSWRFNQSPLFLEFLMGRQQYACTPWGMPTYNVFGWQKPCYLLQDGYADTFAELLEATEWQNYGTESGNPKCANCMVHSGYEASAVNDTFSSLRGLWNTARATFSSSYRDTAALA